MSKNSDSELGAVGQCHYQESGFIVGDVNFTKFEVGAPRLVVG